MGQSPDKAASRDSLVQPGVARRLRRARRARRLRPGLAATDLAFAGAARQARADRRAARCRRARSCRPRSTASRAVDAAAQRLPRRARRARAGRGRPGRRAPRRGRPRGRCSACRSRSRTTPTSPARRRAAARRRRGPPAEPTTRSSRRLRAAGAVIVGKTHVPERMLWPWTESAAFGATRNPWSLEHTPGGSSGGSGAAVAAGMCGAALGTDGAGSIRIPAAFCGVFGIKPQRGRLPLRRCAGGAVAGHDARSARSAARRGRRRAGARRARRRAPAGFAGRRRARSPRACASPSPTRMPPGVAARLGREQRAAVDGDRGAAARARPRGRRARDRLRARPAARR